MKKKEHKEGRYCIPLFFFLTTGMRRKGEKKKGESLVSHPHKHTQTHTHTHTHTLLIYDVLKTQELRQAKHRSQKKKRKKKKEHWNLQTSLVHVCCCCFVVGNSSTEPRLCFLFSFLPISLLFFFFFTESLSNNDIAVIQHAVVNEIKKKKTTIIPCSGTILYGEGKKRYMLKVNTQKQKKEKTATTTQPVNACVHAHMNLRKKKA